MTKARDLADFGSNPDEQTSIITVTVAAVGGSNKFVIDGTSQQTITMAASGVYKFDQSHSSNANHPLKISLTSNGTHGGGSAITVDFVAVGTAGSAGAYVTYTIQQDGADNYFYYCGNHSGMGGSIRKSGNPTAAEILTSIKTVDGTGSGLDADTLDGVEAAALMPKSGGTMTGNLALGDNVKATFGAGSDLQLYHTGSVSVISEQGDGDLNVQTNGANIALLGNGGSEYMANFASDGAAKLFFNNAEKIATTATGITVTGTVAATALTGDGAGITGLSGGGEQTFTASGTITAGQPVGINSNGTISTAVVIKSSVQKPTPTNALSFYGAGYDVGQNKYLLAGRRGTGSGTSVAEAVVATLSGNTFSFGSSQTEFEGFEPYTHPYSVIYDPGSQKNLIIWTRQDNKARSRVGTISGTSVSFGSTATAASGTGGTEKIFAVSAGNNKVVHIARHEVASAGNYNLWATVHTISGTSVTMGTVVDVSGAQLDGGGNIGRYGLCYDSNAGKVVVFYVISGNTTLFCKVGTVSGTSISFGSAVDTGYDMSVTRPKPVFDPSTNKVVLVFADSANLNNSKALVGTVSGTSISFAANPTEMGAIGNPKAVYNSTNNTIVLDYGSLEVVKVSGTIVERDRVFTYTDVNSTQSTLIYDDDNQSIVLMADTQGDCIAIKTASPKFVGLAKANIANGATGKVTVTGGINTSQSGLVSGFDYGLPSDSATLVSGSNNKVGVALSASSILVTEGSL